MASCCRKWGLRGLWTRGREVTLCGVDVSCFLSVPSCFLLGNASHTRHVARWAVHEVGVCHQWSADQWEHDPSGANHNSPKGINRDVGRGGLSAPELLHLGEHHGACSGLAPSSRPQAGACLRRKAHSEERGLEGGSWWYFWTSWISLNPRQPLFLNFPTQATDYLV